MGLLGSVGLCSLFLFPSVAYLSPLANPSPPLIHAGLSRTYDAHQNFFSNRGEHPNPHSDTGSKKKDVTIFPGLETFGKSEAGRTQRSPRGCTDM